MVTMTLCVCVYFIKMFHTVWFTQSNNCCLPLERTKIRQLLSPQAWMFQQSQSGAQAWRILGDLLVFSVQRTPREVGSNTCEGTTAADLASKRKGKQAKSSFPLLYPCIWAVIRRCHPHLKVDLPSSGNLMKKLLWSACQPAFQFIPHPASLATRPAISHTIFKLPLQMKHFVMLILLIRLF